MATASTIRRSRRTWPRWARYVLLAAALLALAALVWSWEAIAQRAAAGAAYGARVGCSCHFVAGRPLDSCRDDFVPGMSIVMLGADDAEKTVTATVPLLASETATWRKGTGCVLDPWRD